MKIFIYSILFFGTLVSTSILSEKEVKTKETLFVIITSSESEIQMMSLILATQSLNQSATVRILICGEAGNLALKDSESPTFKPANLSPKQLLLGLINRGVRVEVCGIYLPNRGNLSKDDLIETIDTANPAEIAGFMVREDVRVVSF